jgi:outer membrane protein OmpA-like peptidoglycan-associated protein
MQYIRQMLLCTIAVLVFNPTIFAQINKRIEKRAKQNVNNKTDRTVDKNVDKAADKLEEGINGLFRKKKPADADKAATEKNSNQTDQGNMDQPNETAPIPTQEPNAMARYTKFSFVQGEKVLAYDDFSQDKVGDLPANWVTTGTCEIVNLDGIEGNWVWFNKTKGNFIPTYLKDFPDNFTLEFDLMYDFKFGTFSFKRTFMMVFTDITNPEAKLDWNGDPGYFFLQKLSDNYVGVEISALGSSGGPFITGRKAVSNQRDLNFSSQFNAKHIINEKGINKPLHISMARMGRRLQVFANEEKVLDITNAFEKDVKLSSARLYVDNRTENDNYYLSNIRYAAGKTDTRSKLLETGKFSTSAILFNSGSATIKPQSYGILKEIATALNAEAGKTVTIVGHTDTDGSADLNQKLSERRAEAVKQILQKEFAVKNSIETKGKGQIEPVADNSTHVGKANNRRVEFIVQ